jgi:hypothetical protein
MLSVAGIGGGDDIRRPLRRLPQSAIVHQRRMTVAGGPQAALMRAPAMSGRCSRRRQMEEGRLMTDRSIDREIEANERRTTEAIQDERKPSVIDAVEDVVTTFARPMSNVRPGEDDVERQREANDEEQRG